MKETLHEVSSSFGAVAQQKDLEQFETPWSFWLLVKPLRVCLI